MIGGAFGCGQTLGKKMGFRAIFRLLACALALATPLVAHATPVDVHYEMYSTYNGKVLSDASGAASGIIGVGSSNWLNDPTLISTEHLTGYLVKFWVDPMLNMSDVTWNFSWALAYGASVTAPGKVGGYTTRTAPVINSVTSSASIAIGTTDDGLHGVSGILKTDTAEGSYSTVTRLMSSGTDVIWNAANTAKTGTASYDLGTTTEVWAYVSGEGSFSGSNNLTVKYSAFGTISASADMTIAQPDPLFFNLSGGDAPGGSGGMGGGNVPEPGTSLLAALAALIAAARSRKRRLKLPR